MSRTLNRQPIYPYLALAIGFVALIAYLRIFILFKRGESGSAPIVLIILATPFLVSGIYGLKNRRGLKEQPKTLITLVILGTLIFILTVVLIIVAAANTSVGQF